MSDHISLGKHTYDALQTVYNAIKEGYRLFDGASDYGNEKQAGEGVARAIKDGLVKREDLCECPFSAFWEHDPNAAKRDHL